MTSENRDAPAAASASLIDRMLFIITDDLVPLILSLTGLASTFSPLHQLIALWWMEIFRKHTVLNIQSKHEYKMEIPCLENNYVVSVVKYRQDITLSRVFDNLAQEARYQL